MPDRKLGSLDEEDLLFADLASLRSNCLFGCTEVNESDHISTTIFIVSPQSVGGETKILQIKRCRTSPGT